VPRPAVWERFQSDPIRLRHQPDIFIPIIPGAEADTNNQEAMSYSNNLITSSPFDNVADYQTNNQTSSQQPNESSHHVSLCVNDLHTTLFIDEDALNSTKTTTNSNSNGSKGNSSNIYCALQSELLHRYNRQERRITIFLSVFLI
jgi:hypothetical protein